MLLLSVVSFSVLLLTWSCTCCLVFLSFGCCHTVHRSSSSGTQRQSKQLLAEHFQGLEEEDEEEDEGGQPDNAAKGDKEAGASDGSVDELDQENNGDGFEDDVDQRHKVCCIMEPSGLVCFARR